MDETPLSEQDMLDTSLIPPIPENKKPQRNWLNARVYFPFRLTLALTLAAAWLLLYPSTCPPTSCWTRWMYAKDVLSELNQ